MTNKELARQFDLLAKLMELHGENPFRIRSYANAYQAIRRSDATLLRMDKNELVAIPGIGEAIASKIMEIAVSGTMKILELLKDKTPEGIIGILGLKGLGAKKIALLWHELGITSIGELEYACLENRLLSLKGFGAKTQESLLEQIRFIQKHAGSIRISEAIGIMNLLLTEFKKHFPDDVFNETGQVRRRMEVIDHLELLGTAPTDDVWQLLNQIQDLDVSGKEAISGISFQYHQVGKNDFVKALLSTTGPAGFSLTVPMENPGSEEEVFSAHGLDFIPAECRDLFQPSNQNGRKIPESLVTREDILGVIHAHSRWSDGTNTIQEMRAACQKAGYAYLVLTDHSKSAFYANGLTPERVYAQWEEIDALNANAPDFTIFKGIESDILFSGELDYDEAMLSGFDLVIASVHSQLKMDEAKANARLIKAIEHPATRILGHLTGRLLLSRPGYPIDHKRIIDACAQNQVAIEINANPHRLDLDWRWLPYALDQGVEIAINPDAHSVNGIQDIQYGIYIARKGGLPLERCINAKSTGEFRHWLKMKRS